MVGELQVLILSPDCDRQYLEHFILYTCEVPGLHNYNFNQGVSLYGKINVAFTIQKLKPLKVCSNPVHSYMHDFLKEVLNF